VLATALNRADILQRLGMYPAPPGAPKDVPGLEFVGVIDQIGDAVTEWKGGERVFGIVAGGSYADQLINHQRLVVSVPEELSDTEAAAVPEVFITAHDALVSQGGMKPGDLVFIHAVAGGVGTAAVQLAHLWGARAIGTAGSDEKLEKVKALAPFYPVNYKKENFQTHIEEAFGNNSIDLILDCVGGSSWGQNIALLKIRGTLILLGLLGGPSAETPLSAILSKRLRIIGTVLRSRPLEEKLMATQAFAHQIVPHFGDKRLRPVIDSVFPFDQLHSATARMESNKNVGKIILTFS
jgi:putative PIG3 family NAD(P)H quinone oxidoreductase